MAKGVLEGHSEHHHRTPVVPVEIDPLRHLTKERKEWLRTVFLSLLLVLGPPFLLWERLKSASKNEQTANPNEEKQIQLRVPVQVDI